MAEIVEEKKSSSAKLNGFVEKNKKIFIGVLCAVVAAIVVLIVVDVVKNNSTDKSLGKIDEISYALTNESAALNSEALSERRTVAKDALSVYTKKGGVVGVRANLLCADLAFQENKYEEALDYWTAASVKGKNVYTSPIAIYNMAVCYEELNDLENAAKNYKLASDSDFVLKSHAKFSYGRVLESMGKIEDAIAVYKELNDSNPDENWSKIAKSRMLLLQAN